MPQELPEQHPGAGQVSSGSFSGRDEGGEVRHRYNRPRDHDITASLTRYREEKTLIDAALSLQTALLEIIADIQKAEEKTNGLFSESRK